jgi:hypothetical protein
MFLSDMDDYDRAVAGKYPCELPAVAAILETSAHIPE